MFIWTNSCWVLLYVVCFTPMLYKLIIQNKYAFMLPAMHLKGNTLVGKMVQVALINNMILLS